MTTEKKTGLDLLREPFPDHLIGKLPKQSKAQADELRSNRAVGISCKICGGWHHKNAVHLDYVGHAALTDRLLDADPTWNWEPVQTDESGAPVLDKNCGMWIRLTVCGVTRLGYGFAEPTSFKSMGDTIKEVIGDALRNAAMRFGAALELWHKGTLTLPEPPAEREHELMAGWVGAVLNGKTAKEVISVVSSKYTLTDEQKKQIEEAEIAAHQENNRER